MLRHGQSTVDNQQLLTLVHGVDRKGRPVIRAYTGNSRHPEYHEYQDVIDKQYQKAARLAYSSRTIYSLYRPNANESCFDCRSQSSCTSTPTAHASTRRSPSLAGSSGASTPIIPDLRGMGAVISRLRCSLAIHSGLAGTRDRDRDLTFLPAIPVRLKRQSNESCSKKKCTISKPDLKEESRKDCPSSVPRSVTASLSYNTDCCQGCKSQTRSKAKKTNKRVKNNVKLR